jgi:hypothetical protein
MSEAPMSDEYGFNKDKPISRSCMQTSPAPTR